MYIANPSCISTIDWHIRTHDLIFTQSLEAVVKSCCHKMTLLISSAKFFKCQGHKHGQNWGPLLLKIDELWINDDLDQEDLLFKLLECFACSRGKFPHDLQLLVEIYYELWNTQIKSIKVIPKLRELVNDVGSAVDK